MVPNNRKEAGISKILSHLDQQVVRLTPSCYSSEELVFWLLVNIFRGVWDEGRADAKRKAESLNYEDLGVLLLERTKSKTGMSMPIRLEGKVVDKDLPNRAHTLAYTRGMLTLCTYSCGAGPSTSGICTRNIFCAIFI